MTQVQRNTPIQNVDDLTNQTFVGQVLAKAGSGERRFLIGSLKPIGPRSGQLGNRNFKIYGRLVASPKALDINSIGDLETNSVWEFRLERQKPIASDYKTGAGLGFEIDLRTLRRTGVKFTQREVEVGNDGWLKLLEALKSKPTSEGSTSASKAVEPKKKESQGNIEALNTQIADLKSQLKVSQESLSTKEESRQRLEEQIEDYKQQVANLDVSHSSILIEKRLLEQESATQRAIIEEARTLGFVNTAGKNTRENDDASQLSLLEQLDLRLIEKKASELGMNLTSNEIRRIVVAYLIAGATGQQVLFAGPPGSGKSTASVQFPKWLGMSVNVIPVRPGWLDSSDLIGYFDSRVGHFEQGPFVDEVIRAQQVLSQQRFHVVVLDEMNIARIENYAADVLSQLEKAHQLNVESDSGIRLYSPETYERLRLIEAGKKGRVSVENEHRILPAKLPIPKNLIVSGTLNHDRTTHAISPKVKDRSLFIKFESHGIELGVESVAGEVDNFAIPFTLFDRKKGKALNRDNPLIGKWNSLGAAILKSGVPNIQPSFRVAEAVRLLPALSEFLEVEVEILFEDLLLMKLAPWIDFENDATNRKQVQDFSSQISELGFSNLSSQLNSVLQTTAGRFSFL
ncbi:MAG: AAA domain-containing protein [Actinobacteria bacterium]|uniref:Unannotated protein n=1 Tax=freshwater metagenome TaxID=449393 RepID=A0A6J7DRZ9_9ZZZZ|nr:AAA domain-containing protein [Actinomycetota bacterium]